MRYAPATQILQASQLAKNVTDEGCMKKFLIIIFPLLCSCSYYEQYAQNRIAEQSRIAAQDKADAEAQRKKNKEIEKEEQERRDELVNYIASKAVVECLKIGFKKNTPEFNQCTYVSITEAVTEIKRQEQERILLAQHQKEQDNLRRREAMAGILMQMGNSYRQPQPVNCSAFSTGASSGYVGNINCY